jgi:hypothetical protein
VTAGKANPTLDARRALVLHDRPLVVDLIELTLNHGVFVVRMPPSSLAEADAILADWQPAPGRHRHGPRRQHGAARARLGAAEPPHQAVE